jgi:hypothetical protein
MKHIALFIFVLTVNLVYSQDYSELRHIQNDSFRVDFYVSTDHNKIKHKDTVFYAWYKSKKVMFTQGASSGDILNGSYKKYFLSGQLSEQGNYKKGVKVGEWKTWDKNGFLVAISNYHSGQLNGKTYKYTNGKLSQIEKYKKGQLKVKAVKPEKIENVSEENEESFFNRIFKKKEKEIDSTDTVEKKKGLKSEKKKSKDSENIENSTEDSKESFFKRVFARKEKKSKPDTKKENKSNT